jgi:hypothetical protein
MRVLSTRPRAGTLEIRVVGADVSLTLRAKVVWAQRLGFRRHEIGLSFIDVDEDAAQILSRISTMHRARSAV